MLETSKSVYLLGAWSISFVTIDYPAGGRGHGHVTHFHILGPGHIFGADKPGHFKFGLQIEQCRKKTCTTSPEEIQVMKLEGYSGTVCNKHVHSTMTWSSRFHCPIGVINKLTTDELWISPYTDDLLWRIFLVKWLSAHVYYTLPHCNPPTSICSGLVVQVVSALLRGSWQDFNWHDASRGPSAIAKLLVEFYTLYNISAKANAIDTSNFVHGSAMWSLSLVMSEYSLSGRGQGHVSNFSIVDFKKFATARRRYTGYKWYTIRYEMLF